MLYLIAEKIPEVFHDVAAGSNDVPCTLGTPDCSTGILGFPAVTGYDQATGLGSVDGYALASSWSNVALGEATVALDLLYCANSGRAGSNFFRLE